MTPCFLCDTPTASSNDTKRPRIGANKYVTCEACRTRHGIPQDVLCCDPLFPHCAHVGGMDLKKKVALELLLPVAYENSWSAPKLADIVRIKPDIARECQRQYAANLLKIAAKDGQAATLATQAAALRERSLAVRMRAFELCERSLHLAEGQLAQLERRMQHSQEPAGEGLYSAPVEDKDGNAPPDNLAADVKTFNQLVGGLQKVLDMSQKASGMAVEEQATIAKAGAPSLSVALGIQVSGERPRVMLVEPPQMQRLRIVDDDPEAAV